MLASLGGFFSNLLTNGLQPAMYAIAAFFIAWGGIGLMFPGERNQEHAKQSLYRALAGLALALLATTIATLIQNAARGQ
jgi:TorA maturation chaperone TorD